MFGVRGMVSITAQQGRSKNRSVVSHWPLAVSRSVTVLSPLLASSSPSLCQITNAIEFGRSEPESVRSFVQENRDCHHRCGRRIRREIAIIESRPFPPSPARSLTYQTNPLIERENELLTDFDRSTNFETLFSSSQSLLLRDAA